MARRARAVDQVTAANQQIIHAEASPAPRPPELLTRPAARPLERGVRIAGRGCLRRPHFGEVLDLEAAGPEPPDPVTVRHVKLDSGRARPRRHRESAGTSGRASAEA